jgi:hypothetical protein
MRWEWHLALGGEKINAYRVLVKNVKEGELELSRRRWEDNIKMNFKTQVGKEWTWFIWLRIGTTGGLLRIW